MSLSDSSSLLGFSSHVLFYTLCKHITYCAVRHVFKYRLPLTIAKPTSHFVVVVLILPHNAEHSDEAVMQACQGVGFIPLHNNPVESPMGNTFTVFECALKLARQ